MNTFITRILATLCMLTAVAVMTVNAQDAQYQDIHYNVDENHLTAEVGSNPRVTGELLIPQTIVVGQHTYTVIAIGDKAFKGCKNLTSIVLPPTIERSIVRPLTERASCSTRRTGRTVAYG